MSQAVQFLTPLLLLLNSYNKEKEKFESNFVNGTDLDYLNIACNIVCFFF